VTDSLEVQAVKRMLAEADARGLSDHPATEEVRKMLGAHDLHGPFNAGALAWWQLNKDMPERDWPVGCCIGNDMNSPEHCNCWVPEFDLQQTDPDGTAPTWQDCETQDGMCHDCAYRPNSPERSDVWEEEALLDMTRSRTQVFFCHEGMRRPKVWRHPDGREVPGSPKDYSPPYVGVVPYRADGRPGLVCGGWAALRTKFLKEVEMHPAWLQDLVDMQAAGEVLPGGMVWVDELPDDGRSHGGGYHRQPVFVAGDVEPIEGGGAGARLSILRVDDRPRLRDRTPLLPIATRVAIVAMLRRHPERWARVYDGDIHAATAIATWLRKTLPGHQVDAVKRRLGPTVAVYARYQRCDVVTTESRAEAL
jgi:hypothetical protein